TGSEVCDSDSRERQPGARHRGVADAACRKTEPQAGGLVQGLPLPSSELEDGAACGCESGVPLRGVVPASGIHRDQPGDPEPGGGAVLQQARDGRAVDQRGEASGEDDAADVAQANRELVVDEFAASTGEDGRTAGETCSLLLAFAGGEPSDEAALWEYAAADRGAVASGGIAEAVAGNRSRG